MYTKIKYAGSHKCNFSNKRGIWLGIASIMGMLIFFLLVIIVYFFISDQFSDSKDINKAYKSLGERHKLQSFFFLEYDDKRLIEYLQDNSFSSLDRESAELSTSGNAGAYAYFADIAYKHRFCIGVLASDGVSVDPVEDFTIPAVCDEYIPKYTVAPREVNFFASYGMYVNTADSTPYVPYR